jgi:hypothetical protein
VPFDAPVVRQDDVADIESDGIADRAGESEEDEQRSLDAVRTSVEGFVEDVCQRCKAEGLDTSQSGAAR